MRKEPQEIVYGKGQHWEQCWVEECFDFWLFLEHLIGLQWEYFHIAHSQDLQALQKLKLEGSMEWVQDWVEPTGYGAGKGGAPLWWQYDGAMLRDRWSGWEIEYVSPLVGKSRGKVGSEDSSKQEWKRWGRMNAFVEHNERWLDPVDRWSGNPFPGVSI